MAILSIWESFFPLEAAVEGRELTEAIWLDDMPGFDGYVSHELIEDVDDAGHLLVVSEWASREDADDSLRIYAGHPNAQRVNQLVTRPRTRFIGSRVRRMECPASSKE